ncbi:MAG: FBP domain-containing protein [Archangiaceae bacterium]|nr:FBP domain-containing protein [Archangiaceae bacterium]
MFKLQSEAELVATFRPKDRPTIEVPKELSFPLLVRDYVSWLHPAGGWAFMVFAVPGGVPTGIVFDTNPGGDIAVPVMCDWCHHSGVGTEVGLLTARLNARKRVGIRVCSDLSCKQKLEDEANRTGRSVLPAMQKLMARVARFATEALKIDLQRTP